MRVVGSIPGLCGVCTFSLCLRAFSSGSLASSNSPKTGTSSLAAFRHWIVVLLWIHSAQVEIEDWDECRNDICYLLYPRRLWLSSLRLESSLRHSRHLTFYLPLVFSVCQSASFKFDLFLTCPLWPFRRKRARFYRLTFEWNFARQRRLSSGWLHATPPPSAPAIWTEPPKLFTQEECENLRGICMWRRHIRF